MDPSWEQEMGDEIQIISPSDFYLLDTLGPLGLMDSGEKNRFMNILSCFFSLVFVVFFVGCFGHWRGVSLNVMQVEKQKGNWN